MLLTNYEQIITSCVADKRPQRIAQIVATGAKALI